MLYKMYRFSAILILCITLAAIIPACSRPAKVEPKDTATTAPAATSSAPNAAGAAEKPTDGDWLISHLPAEMAHLNPFTSTDAYASSITQEIFDTLLRRDNQTQDMLPHVAESCTASDDHLSYTFKIRKGITFSDGQPLTADDVKFSFDIMMAPTTDAPQLRNYYQDITSCEKLDDYTVKYTCNKPYYRHMIMIGSLEILPKHIYSQGDFNTHPNNRNPIGSGPYKLEKWETGQEVVLTRNEKYWGDVVGRKPHFDKRVYKIITDDNAAVQIMTRGEIDAKTFRPEDWIKRTSQARFTERFNKYEYYSPSYMFIGWNSRLPQFSDKMVRRAMTMLLDRETIRKTIYYELAQTSTGNFMPGTPDAGNITPWPFDVEGAKKLLDQAGWVDHDNDGIRDKDGTKFHFEMLITNSSRTAELIATTFQEELKRAGIEMVIRALEWATMAESVDKRKFDSVIMGWSMPPDNDPYQVWHSSQAEKGSNFVAFQNAEADKMIEDARITFDKAARTKLYSRFSEILHEEQPYTFLLVPKTLLALDKRITGVTIYPYGTDSTEWFVPTAQQRYK